MTKIFTTLFAVIVLSMISACSTGMSEQDVTFTRLSDVPKEKLDALVQKTYFFGHQSVGRDTLQGLRDLMAKHPEIKLNVIESEDAANAAPGAFLHSNVGKNREPLTKIEQYQLALDSGLGGKVNAAFLKFCYVDLTEAGDPKVLFEQYQTSVSALKEKYPQTTFVHFTLPLKSVPGGFKNSIKRLIGRDIPGEADNVRRAEYNELLRSTYAGKEPVFDIAKFESIDPATGKAFSFSYNGNQYEAMSPANTYDGGHLTETGRQWIAEQLVVFLANQDQWGQSH